MADSSPMMQQYDRIKADHGDALLFFRLGDFYEMFRQDAADAARLLGLTLTARNGTPMCGIPYHSVKTYIPRLLAAGRKIAICEQVTQPQAGKGIVERQVVQVLSPGTLVDTEFLDQNANNFLLSISALPKSLDLGIAWMDLSTGDLFVQAIPEAEMVAELEAAFSKWQPRELLVQESLLVENAKVQGFIHNHPDALINRFGDWLYDIRHTQEQLCRLIGVTSLKSFGIKDLDPLLKPMAALLHYGERTTCHRLDQIRGISLVQTGQNLNLDETSVKNLELVRNLNDGSRSFSLLAVLDYTRTAMGSRLLRHWLLEPLRDKAGIERRLDQVEQLYRAQQLLQRVREQLGAVSDLQRIANRILLDRAHPKELVALARSITQMLQIIELLDQAEDPSLLKRGFSNLELSAIAASAQEIGLCLQDEPAVVLNEGSIIREGYDPKVDEYRNLLVNGQGILDEYLESERQSSGITSLRVRSNNIIGYYLEVTKSNIAAVPSHFIRKQSLVGGERYTTARLLELEQQISHAQELCIERERQIFLDLRQALKPRIDAFIRLAKAMAEIDVLCGLAWVATAKGYTRPQIFEDTRLVIQGGRHPVVEEYLGVGSFIPNDLSLSCQAEQAGCALITGPNMAGKSTFLRQNALIALMAHIGSFVPAEQAEIGLIDRIFCRVGASDNLARGESTFLVEMNETAFILRMASEKSLVIMDEVGRGTSTQDGLSIAQAILEYLVRSVGCRCLFATHFHELTEIADMAVCNLSMVVEDQDGKVTFLKKVRFGPSGNSYGVHVAQLAGLPDSVILRAQDILQGLRDLSLQATDSEEPTAMANVAPIRKPQVELFGPLDQLELEIKNFDINKSTPLQALAALERWKKLLENKAN